MLVGLRQKAIIDVCLNLESSRLHTSQSLGHLRRFLGAGENVRELLLNRQFKVTLNSINQYFI